MFFIPTLLLTLCTLPACNNALPQPDDNNPITKTTTKGPTTLTITTDKSQMSVAERLDLTLTITTEPNVTIHPPALGNDVGPFTIHHQSQFKKRPEPDDNNKSVYTQTHTLETFTADTHTIPPVTVEFTDNRDPDNPVQSSISSVPFDIEVTAPTEADTDPTQFRDVKNPVDLPTTINLTILYYVLAGLAIAAILIFALYKLINRKRKPHLAPTIPAHEWAFKQLRLLNNACLVEQNQTHEFYFRLSMILRQYIERRFDLNAPERTTEEFLEEMRTTDKLSPQHKRTLEQFLAACDRVKYALYEPPSDEIESAFTAAEDFVTQTIPQPTDRSSREAA